VFVAIPKTGGTWVEDAIAASGVKVERLAMPPGITMAHPLVQDIAGEYQLRFTFVRHPLTWYESYWKFQAGIWEKWEPGAWHPDRDLEPCASDNFPTFVRNCIERTPAYVTRMYDWYIGPPERQFVDYVGRQEVLTDSLVGLLRGLGCDFDEAALRAYPRANVSEKRFGEPVWSRELRDRVIALESRAIRRFYGGMEPDIANDPGPLAAELQSAAQTELLRAESAALRARQSGAARELQTAVAREQDLRARLEYSDASLQAIRRTRAWRAVTAWWSLKARASRRT
jgi:hypothetical protein